MKTEWSIGWWGECNVIAVQLQPTRSHTDVILISQIQANDLLTRHVAVDSH